MSWGKKKKQNKTCTEVICINSELKLLDQLHPQPSILVVLGVHVKLNASQPGFLIDYDQQSSQSTCDRHLAQSINKSFPL